MIEQPLGVDRKLESRLVLGKGKGVFLDSSLFNMLHKGEYVCEYVGEHIDPELGELRHAEYKARGDTLSYKNGKVNQPQ